MPKTPKNTLKEPTIQPELLTISPFQKITEMQNTTAPIEEKKDVHTPPLPKVEKPRKVSKKIMKPRKKYTARVKAIRKNRTTKRQIIIFRVYPYKNVVKQAVAKFTALNLARKAFARHKEFTQGKSQLFLTERRWNAEGKRKDKVLAKTR